MARRNLITLVKNKIIKEKCCNDAFIFYCSHTSEIRTNKFVTIFSPTTNAIMALTVANYLVQPFFPEEGAPKAAVSLIAAACICGLTWLGFFHVRPSDFVAFVCCIFSRHY